MALELLPQIHLRAGLYEAWVAPQAGGRLCRMLWHGPSGDVEVVQPITACEPFGADHWPKQGAFPMLPYTNRLRNALFEWKGRVVRVRPEPGHSHGLHGFGHRSSWTLQTQTAESIELTLQHQADDTEWPWSFEARLAYTLSKQGLSVHLSLINTSDHPMPAILGWHPYVPKQWLDRHEAQSRSIARHDLGAEGLNFPELNALPIQPPLNHIDLTSPGTQVLQGWSESLRLVQDSGPPWCLWAESASHLVVHVPANRAYLCVEPVTAMPGSLNQTNYSDIAAHIELAPKASKSLTCGISLENPV